MAGCTTEDESTACTPLAATDFPCTDSGQCLSVTATWCFPDASICANTDTDLSLQRPDGIIVGVGSGASRDTNGCILDGDDLAIVVDPDGDGETGPFHENITCSAYPHAQPPDRIDAGRYVVEVDDSVPELFSTEIVLLDINVDGQTSCQIVDIGDGPARVEVIYP